MDTSQLDLALHWTARLSAILFAITLASPAWSTRALRGSRQLYLAFMLAHTAHFVFVVRLAQATAGENMFPGGRSVDDVGGWPTVFGIMSFFYALAIVGLIARRAGSTPGHRLRLANRIATTMIGFMFIVTYVQLTFQSSWFALLGILVTVGVLIDTFGEKVRRWRCFPGAPEGAA